MPPATATPTRIRSATPRETGVSRETGASVIDEQASAPVQNTAAAKLNADVRQQTFEFWQPEPIVADTQKPKRAEKRPASENQSTAPNQRTTKKESTKRRTSRWANVTVARLREPQTERSRPSDQTPQSDPSKQSAHRESKPELLSDRQSLMADLRNRAAAISASPAMETADVFSTGSAELDTWLPGGGLTRGRICEWVARRDSGGAATLAMITAAAAIADQSGPIIIVDPTETFYAAAAIACGIPAERIVWCRCDNRRDSVWTLDQALRCRAVSAVWSMLPWHLDDRDARRLQLAAEAGRTPGLFVLTPSEANRPSFAPVRFHVDPVGTPDTQTLLDRMPAFSRPPVDTRAVRVRMSGQRQAILAITPDARLHTLRSTSTSTITSTSTTASTGTRHETVAVSLAARLADPTAAGGQSETRESRTRESRSQETRRRTG